MSKQTAVEWFYKNLKNYKSLNLTDKLIQDLYKQAMQMEKEQINDTIKTEIKLIGNYFDVGKLEQREQGHHIRFTSILKDRFDHYNKK
jgi:hypothetical protein